VIKKELEVIAVSGHLFTRIGTASNKKMPRSGKERGRVSGAKTNFNAWARRSPSLPAGFPSGRALRSSNATVYVWPIGRTRPDQKDLI